MACGTKAGVTVVATHAAVELIKALPGGAIIIGAEAVTLNGTGNSGAGALRNVAGTNSFGGAITRASAAQIRDYSLKAGMKTLRQDGWLKVIQGITSVDEVARMTKGDHR